MRNAIEAMHGCKDGHRVLHVKTERDGDDSVVIEVEDTGTGIDPRQFDSIFDAFITTKSHGMGWGSPFAG